MSSKPRYDFNILARVSVTIFKAYLLNPMILQPCRKCFLKPFTTMTGAWLLHPRIEIIRCLGILRVSELQFLGFRLRACGLGFRV